MRKYIVLFLALALMIVAISGIALAKADRQELVPYIPFGPLDPDGSGKAIVNDSQGDVVLVITVTVKGLLPETTYDVKSCTSLALADWTLLGTLTTNKNGNGHFHRNYRAAETLPPTQHIYLNIGSGVYPIGSGIVVIDEDA